tara:strand:+ start:386 stop:580 length:195 start_codon:yes stop_codon:yes gene_type:complete
MKITKVKKVTTSSESSSPKSLVIVYDNGVQFSFFETDEDKEKNEGEWSAIQAWVADGNTLEEAD